MLNGNSIRFAPVIIWMILGISLNISSASDFHSPRTDALGGAGHASPLLGDSIYLNPSFSSFTNIHALSANYLIYGSGKLPSPDGGTTDYYGHNLNLSVLDGTPGSLFQAGLGFTRRDDANLVHVGASKSFFERLGVGIGGKFAFPNDSSGERVVDSTVSVTGILAGWFQATLIVDNVLETGRSRGFYRELILGTKFNVDKIVLVYIDPHWTPTVSGDQNALGYEAGIEFPFWSDLFLRMGKFSSANIPYQAKYGDGYGIGAGWLGPRLSIDYSFSRVTQPVSAISHNFGLTVFF